MTPAARYASAIAVLDDVLAGASAEKCLTTWARTNRYAGAKDRAAVRDHVFDVLRRKRSLAARGGGEDGRALVLGLLRHQGIDPNSIFGAGGYGPTALTEAEIDGARPPEGAEVVDLPDWLWPIWQSDLGQEATAAAMVLQDRGPVTLRVNLRRGTREAAIAILAEDDIVCAAVDHVKTAIQVIENERRVQLNRAYIEGFVEIQDLASQEAVLAMNVPKGARVLDYCAGGGGKALALADLYDCDVVAHDISSARMADIPARAARSGVTIDVCETKQLKDAGTFDFVFVDAPCSGSGTWRRAPEAKWAISQNKLYEYNTLQVEVLRDASAYLRRGGQIAYATCSVLSCENAAVMTAFSQNDSRWKIEKCVQRLPDELGDGFFYGFLVCENNNL